MVRVLIEEEYFGGWPALHAFPLNQADQPLPTVVVYHGFTRSKEHDSNLAYMLAHAGFRVVMPEAEGHGQRFDGDTTSRLLKFWDILKSCIDELALVRQELLDRRLVLDDRIAVAGLSMGGFVTLGALVKYPWIKAGVSWMGSAYFLDLARTLYPPLGTYNQQTADQHESHMAGMCMYDPSTQLERLADRPLLLWHGVRDEVVSFSESASLHADLVKRGIAQHVRLVADVNATHKLPVGGAQTGVDFLRQVL